MRSDVFQIYVNGGYNSREVFGDALGWASERVRSEYRNSGDLGSCFAFIYQPVTGKRWIVWLNEVFDVKYRLLTSRKAY